MCSLKSSAVIQLICGIGWPDTTSTAGLYKNVYLCAIACVFSDNKDTEMPSHSKYISMFVLFCPDKHTLHDVPGNFHRQRFCHTYNT
jgi:hypothetical protein